MKSRAVAVLWAVFILKGLFYSVLFPMWEGFDEFAHFSFIQHIANHRELTVPDTRVSQEVEQSLALVPLPRPLHEIVLSSTDHDAYWKLAGEQRSARQDALLKIPVSAQFESGINYLYEGKQAPLYYGLMSPIYSWVRTSPLPNRVLLFRLVNVLIGSLIVPMTFIAGLKVFANPRAALAACAFIASMPELYIDTSRIGNQTLAMVLFGLFTLICLRIADSEMELLPAAGIVLGLLLLTKAYAVAAFPPLLVLIIYCIRTTKPNQRSRTVLLSIISIGTAVSISAWWYARNLRLAGAIIWVDGAPTQSANAGAILQGIRNVQWSTALKSLLGTHIWAGGWSFLAVRSWMYQVLEGGMLICAAGMVMAVIQILRQANSKQNLLNRPAHLWLLLVIYGCFFTATAYHVLVSTINSGVAASGGWYLYAVIVPETILVVVGLMQVRWGPQLIVAAVVCFFLLEMYTTHWVLVPYYTGLIDHTADGGLRAFHISQLHNIGVTELLTRLQNNRPVFITPTVLLMLWSLFITASAAVPWIAYTSCTRAIRP